MLLTTLWRRARLLGVMLVLLVSEAFKIWGEAMLTALEREVGISAPAKPFRWSNYRGPGQ